MRETPEDLARLQRLLDESHAAAGPHLRSIITPERRLSAEGLAEILVGMRLLTLATVTADGRPLAAPVDGIFYRGEFWFGSAPESVRFRHIASRPRVSAVHVPGEWLSIVVHGTAHRVDVSKPDLAGFRECCVDIYGDVWNEFDSEAGYARIEALRMFTFYMPDAGDGPEQPT